MTALLPAEASALAEHEQTVERGLSTFLDVGRALLAIRDGRLYRTEHETFESYCEQRWGMARSSAYQFIDAARVADTLSAVADTPLPKNEAQARELAPLLDKPERLRETWQQAVEQTGGKPTAAAIRNIVRPEPPAPAPAVVTTTTTTREQFIADRETGEVLSVEDWDRQARAAEAVAGYVDGSADLTQARLRANFARLVEQAGGGLPLLNAATTADALEPMHFDQAVRLRRRLNEWFDALEAARPRGLRVVEGR